MKPVEENINFFSSLELRLKRFTVSGFVYPWHRHPEFELTWIISGSGTRFIGEHVSDFGPGDVVLVGSNIPHVWLSDDSVNNSGRDCEAVVIHFGECFPGLELLSKDELAGIRNLLKESSGGISFHSESSLAAQKRIVEIESLPELQKYLGLIDLLDLLESSKEYEILTPLIEETPRHTKSKRLLRIEEFVMRHYFESISVSDAADVAGMNKSSFCRFFKRATSQTFSEYLNEIRIGYACKLLAGSNGSITEVCFRCGYNNLSHFNRTFRKIVGSTPTEYRRIAKTK